MLSVTSSEPSVANKNAAIAPKAFWGFLVFLISTTFIPYLQGRSLSDGKQYLWMGYNFDDVCVYLSWMRQGAEGSFRAYNLFTTDPQNGLVANPLFLALGLFAKVSSLPLITVFHLARAFFTITLFVAVKRLIGESMREERVQWACLLLLAFSSGIGWLPPFSSLPGFDSPIDRWQPEAVTYLSLYLNPLFLAAMTLQVLVLRNLYAATGDANRTAALKAGGWGFLLALIHGYDVISVTVVWALYLIHRVCSPANRGAFKQTLLNTAIAGAITLPPALFMYLQIKSNSVFQQRVEVQTLTSSPLWILLGYGFTLCLALYAAIKKQPEATSEAPSVPSLTPFLSVWMLGNAIAAYLPLPFQRKMLQGTHIPIALLAGIGLSSLLASKTPKARFLALGAATLALSISNIAFLFRDSQNNINGVVQTGQHRAYLLNGEVAALEWIESNIPKSEAVQPLPWLKPITSETGKTQTAITDMTLPCYLPSATGRKVYCGHFGETPNYGAKIKELVNLQLPTLSDQDKKATLAKMHVKYILFTQKAADDDAKRLAPAFHGSVPLPSNYKKIYSNAAADLYQIMD